MILDELDLDTVLWTRLSILLVLLLIVACTATAQSALPRLSKSKLRHMSGEGSLRATSLLPMAEGAASLEATLAAGNIAALALTAVAGTLLAMDYLLGDAVLSYGVGAAGLVALLWVQLAGCAVGSARPEASLYVLSWPVRAIHLLMKPVTVPLTLLTRTVVRGGGRIPVSGPSDIEDDLRTIVDAVDGDGALEEEEKEMIHSIFEMGERTAREIMVPRVDVVAIEAGEPLREALERIKVNGHSRIPIYDETIDNVVGIVYAKDLLRHMEVGSLDAAARTIARQPHFIPESKKTNELLHEMQRDKVHMAIVVDEYGGTAGVVTIEDLLEEIVGEIQDEYDTEEGRLERMSESEAVCDARVSIHDVNEALHLSLEEEGEYDTVGGLVYDRLGKIPVVGDEVQVDGLSVTVLSTAGKRIKKVKILARSPEPDPS